MPPKKKTTKKAATRKATGDPEKATSAKRPKRSRRKTAKPPEEVVATDAPPTSTDPVAPDDVSASETVAAAKPKRRRTRRKKTAAAPAGDQTPSIAESSDAGSSAPTTGREPAAFAALGLSDEVLSALRKCQFETPSDIQRELIPVALTGRDCLGQARTGTGKTAAFALPLIERVKPGTALQALVLVPTRELASQVDNAIKQFSIDHPVHTAVVYGGRRIDAQMKQLKRNPEILIATPGRVLDLYRRKLINFDNMTSVVLDEVDRMLDIGFRDDIRRILRKVEQPHQTIFVSATMDEEIRKLAMAFMRDPIEINVSGDSLTVENIEHGFVSVLKENKFASLLGFLKSEVPALVIVFTNTKHQARRVALHLKKEGVSCQEIHGDLHQSKRERVMQKFRDSAIQVLVATDLASRGLDVLEVSHIVNYDVPEDSAVYVHRIGRTARMGKRGYAVTFVTPEEGDELTAIEMLINKELPQFEVPWVVKPLPKDEPPEPVVDEGPPPVPPRYADPLIRHDGLEKIGVRPPRRTLGSRFRATRRRR
jgi:ATP-dependent RNA helicase DeaD